MTRTNDSLSPRRAIVIGGSMSGLFAASLLRKAGWQTDVYERSDVELRGRGAGIVTHPDLIQSLERSGAELDDLGVTVHERVALDSDGNVIERLPYEQIVTSWDRLHQIMRATIPRGTHHLGYSLKAIEQDPESVTAIFENGERVTGDLLVGADGFRSVVRNMFAPEIQPIYAGYVVWRGLADEGLISREAHEAVFEKFAFFLPPQNKNIGYPIAGPNNDLRPGHRRWNWVWYRAVARAELDDMLVDEQGVHHAVSIPPPKVRSDVIARLRKDARDFLPPPMLEILSRVSKPFFTPIYDLLVDRMAYGRVVLIGDAAAVARPHVGMGIAKAGTDAEVLADSIASAPDLLAGLARFERERLPIAGKAVAQGRCLGEYMLDHASPGTRADDAHWREFHSIPGILKHTASSAFLRSA
ncbi:FAD binding domain-containing protein [Bradyrhizobium sp. Tv2a-2]|uniref:FAD binding domain-containing protein n=1 Tax=Bradyrhizobium sp. Tv2a-2 TaxID=113395 RepID=UPI0004109E62|nr:FAD binding domain-containing protein [Bradyrhizobium sp. Tv2a-2]